MVVVGRREVRKDIVGWGDSAILVKRGGEKGNGWVVELSSAVRLGAI